MTIAARFICSDGIILCADTEQTQGEAKYEKDKIFGFEDHLLVTGAGDSAFIKMAFDKLCDKFNEARPVNPSDARDMIEEIVLEIHDRHIFHFYEPSDPTRPQLYLIVGTRCTNVELALIKADNSAAFLADMYVATGAGQPLFEYWAKYFYRANLNMDVQSYLALFILREVKRSSVYCGGWSRVARLPRTPFVPRPGEVAVGRTVYSENDLLVGFPDTVVRILSVLTDLSVSDSWIDAKLQEFSNSVKAVRTELRNAHDYKEAILRRRAEASRQPDKSEPVP